MIYDYYASVHVHVSTYCLGPAGEGGSAPQGHSGARRAQGQQIIQLLIHNTSNNNNTNTTNNVNANTTTNYKLQ